MKCPFVYVRPEPKTHGRKNQIEGQLENKAKVLVVEDLISTGKSSLDAVKALKNAGAQVLGMIALFNYNLEIASQNFANSAIQLSTLSDYDTLISEAVNSNYVKKEEIELLKSWRSNPSKWNPN